MYGLGACSLVGDPTTGVTTVGGEQWNEVLGDWIGEDLTEDDVEVDGVEWYWFFTTVRVVNPAGYSDGGL